MLSCLRTSSRRRWSLAIAIMLFVLGTGANASVATGALPRLAPGTDPIEDHSALPLYEVTTATSELRMAITDGILARAERCMAAAGFEWIDMPGDPSPTRDRYGLDDVDVAQRSAYADPNPVELDGAAFDPPERYLHALVGDQDAGGHEVVVRAPDGSELGRFFRDGCLWEAEQAVFGDWAAYEADRTILHGTAIAAHREARTAPTVVEAMDDWSSCMAVAGYEVTDLEDLRARVLPATRSDGDGSNVSESEKELAVADASCNLAVGLADAWYAAEIDVQAAMVATDRTMLDRFLATLKTAAERSRAGT